MPNPDLRWITINDFSPGIQARLNYVPGKVQVAPLGAATPDDTYRCIALPTGGLGPLPRRTDTLSLPSWPSGTIQDDRVYVSGMGLFGPIAQSAPADTNWDSSELMVAVEWVRTSSTPTRFYRVYRINLWDNPSPTFQNITPNLGQGFGNDFSLTGTTTTFTAHHATRFASTRVNKSSPTTIGSPHVSYSWGAIGTSTAYWHVFPDPDTLTTNSSEQVGSVVVGRCTLLFGHQGRLVGFVRTSWDHGSGGVGWASNEEGWYTQPNTITFANSYPETFGQHEVRGFGAGASTSASELFLVRNLGGAFVVRGDLSFPTVVTLPNVQSTHGAITEGINTPIGFVYYSRDQGVWAWQGGEASVNLSRNLEGNFIKITNQSPGSANSGIFGEFGKFAVFGDWVLCPNNWLFDYTTESWWRIQKPDSFEILRWCTGVDSANFFGTPVAVGNGEGHLVHAFKFTDPARNFRWHSHPIQLSVDRRVTIREVLITAVGIGTVTVTLRGVGGDTASQSVTFASNVTVRRQRFYVSLDATHVEVEINSDGDTNPAPTVFDVSLGYRESQHIATS